MRTTIAQPRDTLGAVFAAPQPRKLRPAVRLSLLALLTGCASQGPLRPPSLHLPAPPAAASAQRVGNTVQFHWANPLKTTDGGDLLSRHEHALPLIAELCRVSPAPQTACTPVARVPASPGQPGNFTDNLPLALSAGSPAPLRYRLRIRNSHGRATQPTELLTAAGAAPPPVRDLTAAAAALGTSLGWHPEPPQPGDTVFLRVHPAEAPAQPVAPRSSSRVTLLHVDLTSRDPGGAIDSEGKPGDTYTALRSRPLPGTAATLQSEPSTITLSLTALPPPPTTPVGLATVASSISGAPRVDLSWQPDTASVGYLIFRSEAGGPKQQLTPTPIAAISYTDTAVRPGLSYSYSIVAVDPHGTRSNESVAATETAPAP